MRATKKPLVRVKAPPQELSIQDLVAISDDSQLIANFLKTAEIRGVGEI